MIYFMIKYILWALQMWPIAPYLEPMLSYSQLNTGKKWAKMALFLWAAKALLVIAPLIFQINTQNFLESLMMRLCMHISNFNPIRWLFGQNLSLKSSCMVRRDLLSNSDFAQIISTFTIAKYCIDQDDGFMY